MSNVHPFPAGGKSAKSARKKGGRANGHHAAIGEALLIQDIYGRPVDVLEKIIQAGGLYLAPSDARSDVNLEAAPSAQFLWTVQGLDTLIDAANVLIYEAQRHPERMDQESVDGLDQQAKTTHKLIQKLDAMLPTDEFILSPNSFGPEFMAEYATNAAMLMVSRFAISLLGYYDAQFIRTKKDRRKDMMMDFVDVYREVIQDCQIHINAHDYLLKELASAQRAMNKVMKEL